MQLAKSFNVVERAFMDPRSDSALAHIFVHVKVGSSRDLQYSGKSLKKIFAVLLLAFLVISAEKALAQPSSCNSTNNSPYTEADVCSLDGRSITISYSSGTLDYELPAFSTVSCGGAKKKSGCQTPVNFRIKLTDIPGTLGGFSLQGVSGEISVNINFVGNDTAASPPLNPDQWYQASSYPYAGSTTPANASLSISLTPPTGSITPGTYSNTFTFSMERNEYCPQGSNKCAAAETVSATFQIAITVDPLIQISGLNDIALPSPNYSNYDDFCVFTQGGGAFQIKATSETSGGSGPFKLAENPLVASGNEIEYLVAVEKLPSGSSSSLAQGQGESMGAGSTSPDCSNMRVNISLPSGAIDNANAPSYTDTLTLTVETE